MIASKLFILDRNNWNQIIVRVQMDIIIIK